MPGADSPRSGCRGRRSGRAALRTGRADSGSITRCWTPSSEPATRSNRYNSLSLSNRCPTATSPVAFAGRPSYPAGTEIGHYLDTYAEPQAFSIERSCAVTA